jgi:hypothetical protein
MNVTAGRSFDILKLTNLLIIAAYTEPSKTIRMGATTRPTLETKYALPPIVTGTMKADKLRGVP